MPRRDDEVACQDGTGKRSSRSLIEAAQHQNSSDLQGENQRLMTLKKTENENK